MATTTLQTDHGKFVCAEEGGGIQGALVEIGPDQFRQQGLATADRPAAGAWETFTVEQDGDVWYLKSCGDATVDPPIPASYGCAENEGQDGVFVFNRTHGGAWEALIVHQMADGRVAFEVKCRPHHFLCAEGDGKTLSIRQPMWEEQPSEYPGGFESFTSSYNFFGSPPITGIPLAGPVRVVGEVYSDNNGPFVPIGCHFGEAFSAWCRGRQNEVTAQMHTIRKAGYDHVRVWLNLGYYPVWKNREVAFTRFQNKAGGWVEQTPNYSDQRLAFDQMLDDVGIRGLFSRGDCNSMTEQNVVDHLNEERRVLSHHPQTIFGIELMNEKWQNSPPSLATNEPQCRKIMEAAFGGTGWVEQNSCPPSSGEEPASFAHMVQNWFFSQPVHPTRAFDDMEFLLRHCFNDGYERYPGGYTGKPYAMEATEPGGPGQGVSVGNTSELWKIMAMHAALLIGRCATVYMSGHGVFWNGPIENQPGFWEVPKLRALFPMNAFQGRSFHGNRAEAWVTSAGGMNNVNPNGYARVDQLLGVKDGVAIAHHGGAGRALAFRVAANVQILNWDLTERMAFASQPGYVRNVGGDCLVVMKR